MQSFRLKGTSVRLNVPAKALKRSGRNAGSDPANPDSPEMAPKLLFRQLFEKDSCTYTYLLADVGHHEKPALLIDPVEKMVDRDANLIKELGLKLVFVMNTHVHADHITGTGTLKGGFINHYEALPFFQHGPFLAFLGEEDLKSSLLYCAALLPPPSGRVCSPSVASSGAKFPGVQSVISEASKAKADILVCPNDKIYVGNLFLEVRATPGHTQGCVTYVTGESPNQPHPRMAFTGDALLIRGCGRTDFQAIVLEVWENACCPLATNGRKCTTTVQIYTLTGSACVFLLVTASYRGCYPIFTLPKETLLYPAHDYKGLMVTTVEEELLYNTRLTKDEDAFIDIMKNLGLAHPKMMDVAVPINMVCGFQDSVKASAA
eukprot:Gb_08617 [translate_table: standard]